MASELDKEVRILLPGLPNPSLYPWPSSAGAELRFTSKGTRYRRARMDFHPYTQITREDRLSPDAGFHQPEGRLHPVRA
jgi:hypothetical protein